MKCILASAPKKHYKCSTYDLYTVSSLLKPYNGLKGLKRLAILRTSYNTWTTTI